MFINLYIFADTDNEAKSTVEKIMHNFMHICESYIIHEMKPYWKIAGIYDVDLTLNLKRKLEQNELEKTLLNISDDWLKFGNPPTEYLASDTSENSNYIFDGLKMIVINLE